MIKSNKTYGEYTSLYEEKMKGLWTTQKTLILDVRVISMKRSPLKRTPFKKRVRVAGHETSRDLKEDIQKVIRELAIKRDKGCVLRHYKEAGACGGYRNDGELILQAEHLITRSNAGTFGDMRNIVCLCLRHHGYFKPQYSEEYWQLIKKHLGPMRWSWYLRAKEDRTPHKVDWKLLLVALKHDL